MEEEYLLPEIHVVGSSKDHTHRGSYTNYTGNETIVPSFTDYIESRRELERLNKALSILNTEIPEVPDVPYTPNLYSKIIATGLDFYFNTHPIINNIVKLISGHENSTSAILGSDPYAETCIYTDTKSDSRQTSGNKTFIKEMEKGINGYEPVNEKDGLKIGDKVHLWGKDGKEIHHTGKITGFTEDGKPTITYSDGGQGPGHMKYDIDNWGDLGEVMTYSRFYGTDDDKRNWYKEYKRKFGSRIK